MKKRRPRSAPMSPHLLSLLGSLGLPAFITAAWSGGMDFPPLPVWLVMANLTMLVILGKDKIAAGKPGWSRTPEFTLLALTFLGATPAMLIGRWFFSHKTTKPAFVAALWATVALQAGAAYYYRETLLQWL